MLKTLRDMAVGAIMTFAAVVAVNSYAVVGTPPGTGPGLVDGTWLNGIVQGLNATSQFGITAAGTTQATATALPNSVKLIEVGTVGASTGVNLPTAVAGTEISLYNAGANTLTVYPAVRNNPATAAQDTINAGTSTTIAANASKIFYVPKTGDWAAQ